MDDEPILIRETPLFTKAFDKIASEKERRDLYVHLAARPDDGDVISGSGGLRKLRWKRPGMGKRGGMRVIYYYFDQFGLISLLVAYAKSEKEDISKQDVAVMAALVDKIKEEWRRS